MNKTLLAGLSLAAVLPVGCQSAKEVKQPNIMLILCEDISPYLGCYGDTVAVSPNIDKFSESCVRFTDMHTTVGVSSPSRFALATGMYPSAMGANYMRSYTWKTWQYPEGIEPYYVVLPDEVKGYGEYLRQAGYYCAYNGKQDYQFNTPLSLWDETGSKAHYKNRPDGMPFFAVYNLMITHESNLWEQGDKPLSVDPADVVVPPYYPDNDIVRHDIAVMYSNITRMDTQMQKILDELKERGEDENTIVIFMSDNGGPMPSQKRSIYEKGTHVPFMIHFPDGYGAGTVDDRLAMFVDVPATILSLAGICPPDYMHGQALFGKYRQKKEREYVYAARDRMAEHSDKQGAVRDHRYRYVRNYQPERPNYLGVNYRLDIPMMVNWVELRDKGELNEAQMQWFAAPRGEEEFYDDIADPHSINNLIDDPAYSEDIARLRKAYDEWIEGDNKPWMRTEREAVDQMHPTGAQETLPEATITKQGDKLSLTSSNKGASLVYKINGKGLTEKGWYLYTKPIEGLQGGDTISVVATRAGYDDSAAAEYIF